MCRLRSPGAEIVVRPVAAAAREHAADLQGAKGARPMSRRTFARRSEPVSLDRGCPSRIVYVRSDGSGRLRLLTAGAWSQRVVALRSGCVTGEVASGAKCEHRSHIRLKEVATDPLPGAR
jgi:hypothetical protein